MLPDNFKLMPLEKRQQWLQANADKIDRMLVTTEFEDEKNLELVERFKMVNAKLEQLTSEFDDIKSEWKARIDPIKDEYKEILGELKTGMQTQEQEVYLLADQEANKMYIYLADGTEYRIRPLFKEERQGTIYALNRERKGDSA